MLALESIDRVKTMLEFQKEKKRMSKNVLLYYGNAVTPLSITRKISKGWSIVPYALIVTTLRKLPNIRKVAL